MNEYRFSNFFSRQNPTPAQTGKNNQLQHSFEPFLLDWKQAVLCLLKRFPPASLFQFESFAQLNQKTLQ